MPLCNFFSRVLFLFLTAVSLPGFLPAQEKTATSLVDAARVAEIAVTLEPKPRGVGPSLDDRTAWTALGAESNIQEKLLPRATRFLSEPIPEVSEAAFAESARTTDRKIDAPVGQRRFRLVTFILAEGVENQGRFLPAIEKEIAAICSESVWTLSGHVKFTKGNDLGSAMTAWNLSTAATMLGSRLSPDTQKLIRTEVQRRVIQPYLDEIHGTRPVEWWALDANNWNAVVHGGIVGSALALTESVQERAEIIAAAEKETQSYIKGFPQDGYSPEGMGYWKYGFGHYVMLSEAVLAATGGKVNFYAKENIRKVAQFPRRFETVTEVYPAYADAVFMEEPSRWLFNIIDRRYGLGDHAPRTLMLDGMFSAFLYSWGINMAFNPDAPAVVPSEGSAVQGHRLRDWFEQSQVLVSRLPEGKSGLTFSFKGGTNGASHGHNDIGTYAVVVGKQPIVADPGGTVYDGTTFGPKRFENPVLGSYGHPVPLIAGQWQKTGVQHAAEVIKTEFTDASDTVTLSLKKGYEVPSLRTLNRTYVYNRANAGTVSIRDEVEFESPQAFGTALITFGEAVEEKPGVWAITMAGQKVRAEIDAAGQPFTVTNEVLKNEARAGKVRRLGINLGSPSAKAVITVSITPVP